MLPGTATTEILPGYDDFVVSLRRALFDELDWIKVIRKPNHRIGSEFFVFLRDSRDQRQILGRDDLVSINIVFDYVNRTGELICHNFEKSLRGGYISPRRINSR